MFPTTFAPTAAGIALPVPTAVVEATVVAAITSAAITSAAITVAAAAFTGVRS